MPGAISLELPTRRRSSNDYIQSRLRRRRWTRATALIFVVILVLSAIFDRGGFFGHSSDDWETFDRKTFTVTHVADGDTLFIRPTNGGTETRVRLIGIDAPEMNFEDKSPAYWAEEARKRLIELADRKPIVVRLEQVQTRDRYGRLLAHIYLPDDDNIALTLVRDGHVYADRRFDHSHRSQFELIETEARKKTRGLWAGVTFEQMPPWRQDWLRRVQQDRTAWHEAADAQ